PRSISVTVTRAPLTTAPLGSVTVPTMLPLSFCAKHKQPPRTHSKSEMKWNNRDACMARSFARRQVSKFMPRPRACAFTKKTEEQPGSDGILRTLTFTFDCERCQD